MRSTHTYAMLPVSRATWEEIAAKLREANYSHAFDDEEGVIDMNGIGLSVDRDIENAAPQGSVEIAESPAATPEAPAVAAVPRLEAEARLVGAALGAAMQGVPLPAGCLDVLTPAPSPLGGFGEVLAEYDRITNRLDPRDAEADFVMRGSDWRVIRDNVVRAPSEGRLVDALRPVVSEIFSRFGSLSRGEALQLLCNALKADPYPEARERLRLAMNFIEEWSNWWSYALAKDDNVPLTPEEDAAATKMAESLGSRAAEMVINNRRFLARPSIANVPAQIASALRAACYLPGHFDAIKHLSYCRWCHYEASHPHEDGCPMLLLQEQPDAAPTSESALATMQAEVTRLHLLINSPETEDFDKGVPLECAHQGQRWGEAHDRSKSSENWYWLVGYLAGKALRASILGDRTKALHHTISTAAALRNWHKAIKLDASGAGVGQDPDLVALDGGEPHG